MMFLSNSKITGSGIKKCSNFSILLSVLFFLVPIYSNAEIYTQSLTIDTYSDNDEAAFDKENVYKHTLYETEDTTKKEKKEPERVIIIDDSPSVFTSSRLYHPYTHQTVYVLAPPRTRGFTASIYSHGLRSYRHTSAIPHNKNHSNIHKTDTTGAKNQ